ncbi:UNVERIFIED_CONTAM: hypothetical protein H355_009315 [Colinus virginianus]|nr:hypothetical protein H355_009315 [Colinus virginianus]
MAAVPEEPVEVAAVKPDPEAGTPPQAPAATPATATPPAPSAAADGEAAGNSGDAASAKPAAPGPAASPASLDRQTLVAVLQFLRRSNLRESEEILRREARLLGEDLGTAALSPAGAGLPGAPGGEGDAGSSEALLSRVTAAAAGGTGGSVAPVASSSPGVAAAAAVPPGKVGGGVVVEDQPDVSAVLSAYNQQGDPTLYEEYYSGLKNFIECSLDCHRAELSQLFYPLFVHMYLELVYNQHESEAKSFFERFHGDQECYYQDDLRVLSSLTKKEHMKGNETMLDFRTSKFVLRISRDSYQLLKRHLQEKQNNQIWNIVQEHLYIDIFDGMPRSKQQIDAMVGSLAGEAKREANKAKVFFGLLKEPEFDVPLDDEDEEGENEEGKPKKKKPKRDSVGSKSKKQDPNAPPQNRYQGNDVWRTLVKPSIAMPDVQCWSRDVFSSLSISAVDSLAMRLQGR